MFFETNNQKNEYFKVMKKIKDIEGHYGLKMILEFGWSGS